MLRPLLLAGFLCSLCALSCQKDLNSANNNTPTNFADDTSKIISVIQYDFSGSMPSDSFLTVYRNHTVGGVKQIIGLSTYYGALTDTTTETYSYNSNNQLVRIDVTYRLTPAVNELYRISWSGDNVSQITEDSAGITVRTYQYQYSASGANTTISYTANPNPYNYSVTGTGGGLSYSYHTNSTLTVNGSFVPQYETSMTYYYLSNNGGSGFPANNWDTTKSVYAFTNSDLASISSYHSASDSSQTIAYLRDTIVSAYNRSLNDNLAFTNFLSGLYGTKLYTLLNFFETPLPNYETPETFSDYTFNNRALLNKITVQHSWQNGMPTVSYTDTTDVMLHRFDSQNRLVYSESHTYGGVPEQAMRVIYQ